MDVHASPASLPELDAFLSTFKVRFRRSEARAALERYLTGLLTQLPNKNCDTLAQAVPGTHEQRLQGLLTTMQWDEEDLNRQRVEKMIAEATIGNGVLIVDDTGFAKQGQASVGVARQYSGTLGKVGNCRNRSGGTNDHAAARRWYARSSVGSKEGATSSRKAASHAAVR
jgi:SRSO17 transposase